MPGNILEPENVAVNEIVSMFPWSLNSSSCGGYPEWGSSGSRLDKYTKLVNSEKIKQDNRKVDY